MSRERDVIFKILKDIEVKKAYSDLTIERYLKTEELVNPNLVREVVYGVLENKIRLDYIIEKFSNIKKSRIHPNIMILLEMGIYELLYLDGIPERASIYEVVELGKKYGNKGSVAFLNGILRSVSRNAEKSLKIEKNNKKVDYLSIKYSHPTVLVEKLIKDYGLDFTEKILKDNNKRPEMNIRVNQLKTSRQKLISLLKDRRIEAVETEYSNSSLIIKNPLNILETDLYGEGYFTIQDEASSLVGQVVDLDKNKDNLVIDLCSGPGGKASHISELLEGKGRIIAFDIHKHRLRLIEKLFKRLELNNLETVLRDGRNLDESLISKADIVLVDVPCTALGLIKRKPEIKYRVDLNNLDELIKTQVDLLESGSKYVKSGGQLIYSTCTINKDENFVQVEKFLNKNKDFYIDKIKNVPDKNINSLKDGYIELFGHINETDGFFICKMKKK